MSSNNKNKEQLIEGLKEFIQTLEKPSVTVKEFEVSISQGTVDGVDPDNYAFKTHHPNGELKYTFVFGIYDKDRDESNQAYDPMSEIKKELGYDR